MLCLNNYLHIVFSKVNTNLLRLKQQENSAYLTDFIKELYQFFPRMSRVKAEEL
jgi:hypothetical protein